MLRRHWHTLVLLVAGALAAGIPANLERARAQTSGPEMLAPTLDVRTVVDGLNKPISIAFLGDDDLLVLEKGTGMVKRV